jgi:hypothetical protein
MEEDIERRLERLESLHLAKPRRDVTWFNVLAKLLLPASIAGLGLLANSASNKIQAGHLALARAQEQRQAQESRTALHLRYLDLVYADLKSNDPETQTSALGLLIGVDPEIGLTLARAVANNPGTGAKVRDSASRVARAIERYEALAAYKIGIYLDRENKALDEMAVALQERFRQDGFPGRVQIYRRTSEQLRSLGLAAANEIRYDEPFESEAAGRLQLLLSEFQPDGAYHLVPASTPTPRFVSIFLVKTGTVRLVGDTMILAE